MNVTVKVLCQLTIVLAAFLGQSVAKYSADSEFNDRGNGDSNFFETENYSEFTDDEIPHGVIYGDRGPVDHDREKRDTRGRARRGTEFQEEKKNKYENEQDWNAEELQVEEGEELPLEELEDGEIEEDTNAELKSRKTRSAKYQNEMRYDTFEDDAIVEESRPPSRKIKAPRSAASYEVNEHYEEASDPLSSESAPPPAVLYHGGVQYVQAADQHHHATHGAGAPPLVRYSNADMVPAASKKKSHSSKKAAGGGHESHASHDGAAGKKVCTCILQNHHISTNKFKISISVICNKSHFNQNNLTKMNNNNTS